MDRLSDEQVLMRMQAGEVAALTVLIERYHLPLLRYLYRLTGSDRSLAEDLVQEAFLRVLSQRTYRAGQPVKPWLYAIATNLTRDHFKSAAVRRTAAGDERTWLGLVDAAPRPEERALASELGGEAARAIGQLGEGQRAVLLLRLYQDLSLQEIAQALDIPLGTVKSRLSAGLRRLRRLLATAWEGATPQ